jgi:hypothetical protein
MKTKVNVIPIHEQVSDMLFLINLLSTSNYSTLYEAQTAYPSILKTLKKLDQYERRFLLEKIESLR